MITLGEGFITEQRVSNCIVDMHTCLIPEFTHIIAQGNGTDTNC